MFSRFPSIFSVVRGVVALLAFHSPSQGVAEGRDGYFWRMSGSVFSMFIEEGQFQLRYHHVRSEMEREGVSQGSLSFAGHVEDGRVTGFGYLYSGRCHRRISYEAGGRFSPDFRVLTVSGNASLLDERCRQVASTTRVTAIYESMRPPGEVAQMFAAVAATAPGPLGSIVAFGAQTTAEAYFAGLNERDQLSLSRAKNLAVETGGEIYWRSDDGRASATIKADGDEFWRNGRRCREFTKDNVIIDGRIMPSHQSVECLYGSEWRSE